MRYRPFGIEALDTMRRGHRYVRLFSRRSHALAHSVAIAPGGDDGGILGKTERAAPSLSCSSPPKTRGHSANATLLPARPIVVAPVTVTLFLRHLKQPERSSEVRRFR